MKDSTPEEIFEKIGGCRPAPSLRPSCPPPTAEPAWDSFAPVVCPNALGALLGVDGRRRSWMGGARPAAAGHNPHPHREPLSRAFADKNKSGTLDVDEFQSAFKELLDKEVCVCRACDRTNAAPWWRAGQAR